METVHHHVTREERDLLHGVIKSAIQAAKNDWAHVREQRLNELLDLLHGEIVVSRGPDVVITGFEPEPTGCSDPGYGGCIPTCAYCRANRDG